MLLRPTLTFTTLFPLDQILTSEWKDFLIGGGPWHKMSCMRPFPTPQTART